MMGVGSREEGEDDSDEDDANEDQPTPWMDRLKVTSVAESASQLLECYTDTCWHQNLDSEDPTVLALRHKRLSLDDNSQVIATALTFIFRCFSLHVFNRIVKNSLSVSGKLSPGKQANHPSENSILNLTGPHAQYVVQSFLSVHYRVQNVFYKESYIHEFMDLLNLSGHAGQEPYQGSDYLCVTDTEVAGWDSNTLLQKHKHYNLHIIPENPEAPKSFSLETCQALGINVYQRRQLHGNALLLPAHLC
jgi:hypothetical protein